MYAVVMPRVTASRTRPALAVLTAALVLACTAPPPTPATPAPTEPPAAPEIPAKPAVPLVLELSLPDTTRAESGSSPRFAAQLRNTSNVAQKAVLSGDGSAAGDREPHVSWSGEYDPGDGNWRPMTRKTMLGCGMYDENWHDEIVTIAPGTSTSLGPWIGAPDYFHDLTAPGRYRVQLHYTYTAGRRDPASFAPGDMAGVEPFELVSAPIEFTVFRPLELVLQRRTGAKPPRRLSDVLEANLVSKSAEGKQLPPLTSSELQLLGDDTSKPTPLHMAFKPSRKGVYVAAGATVDVLALADLDWSPALDAPGTRVRLRLGFAQEAFGGPGPGLEILSEPFTLTP